MASQLAMTGLRQHARDAKHDRPFFALNLIWRHFLEVDNRAGQAAKMDGYRCPSRLVGCDDAGLMSALPGVRSPCVYTLEVEFGTDELFESRFFRPPKGGVCVTQKITELQYMRHTPHAKQPSWRTSHYCMLQRRRPQRVCHYCHYTHLTRCLLPCYANIWRQQL
jgi:hypothetical protein